MNDDNDRFNDIDADLNFITSLYPDLNNKTANQYFNFEALDHLQKSHDEFSISSSSIRSLTVL